MSGRPDERLLAAEQAVKEIMPELAEVRGLQDGASGARGHKSDVAKLGKARSLCELIYFGHTVRDASRILKIGEDSAQRYTKTPHFEYLYADVSQDMQAKLNFALFQIAKNAIVEAINDAREAMQKSKNGFLRQRIREWMFDLYKDLEKMQPGGGQSLLKEVFKRIEKRKVDENTTESVERTFVRHPNAPGGGAAAGSERVAGGEDRSAGAGEADGRTFEARLLAGGDIVDVEPENVEPVGTGENPRTRASG